MGGVTHGLCVCLNVFWTPVPSPAENKFHLLWLCGHGKESTSQSIINQSNQSHTHTHGVSTGRGSVTRAERREEVVPGILHRGRGGERDARSAQMVSDPRAAVFIFVPPPLPASPRSLPPGPGPGI